MRKLTVAEFISLDGVVEAPERWHFPYVSQELFAAMWAVSAECDTMLLGRNTYENFAGAFADAPADNPVAAQMNRPAKVVVSATLTELTWAKSTLLDGPVEKGVAGLKERAGSGILTTGSTKLVRSLLRAGLVDELVLMIHPIVVGSGERLFEDDGPEIKLELVGSTTFSSGVTNAVYRTA
ncbi:MAG TPA: dihydrofolate reductase family protein [Micromonosporaceae bacterium]|nr:dihydrofolate reductase family protein [Micromonosporaceae bacterium]